MATLVTGGTGTIGSNVVRELASRGHEVISFDIEPVSELELRDVEPWGRTGDLGAGEHR
jgi:nucleoside-diphosphate-sugar epimerase